jgi:hypothetical protein
MNYLKSEYDNIFVKYKKAEAAEIIKKKDKSIIVPLPQTVGKLNEN